MRYIPTVRSHFSFEQFEEVLQKLAHKKAIDAITNLNQGNVRIVINGNRFSRFDVIDKLEIHFYVKHVSYFEYDRTYEDWWGFDVEEKLYLTSNHCTKISFYAPEGKEKERIKKITKFIDEIMAGVKTVPRFSLTQLRET